MPETRCPKCDAIRQVQAEECPACGIIFARYARRSDRPPIRQSGVHEVPEHFSEKVPIAAFLTPETARNLTIGFVAGLICILVAPLRFVLSYLVILIHEMGHALCWWLMGFPAIPSFDFVYGGGVTMHYGRNALLLGFICILLTIPFYFLRRSAPLLVGWGMFFAVYLTVALTPVGETFALIMGHGTELLFAGLALYRSVTGSGVKTPAERPLYAMLGFHILFKSLTFSWQLMFDEGFRIQYGEAKGGGHWMDFSRVAEAWFGGNLTIVAFLFGCAALATPLAVWWLLRHRERIWSNLHHIWAKVK